MRNAGESYRVFPCGERTLSGAGRAVDFLGCRTTPEGATRLCWRSQLHRAPFLPESSETASPVSSAEDAERLISDRVSGRAAEGAKQREPGDPREIRPAAPVVRLGETTVIAGWRISAACMGWRRARYSRLGPRMAENSTAKSVNPLTM